MEGLAISPVMIVGFKSIIHLLHCAVTSVHLFNINTRNPIYTLFIIFIYRSIRENRRRLSSEEENNIIL